MARIYRFILLLFSFCIHTQAQKLQFQLLGVENGLPSSEVYNLYQDPKGYIWAFTEFGIAKHNGSHFIPAGKNLPFEESTVYAMCESPRKELYIGNSKAHIYRLANDSAFLLHGMEKLSYQLMLNNETIYAMQMDDSSNIWFSTFSHSYMLEKSTNRITDISRRYREDSVGIVYKKIRDSYFFIKLGPTPSRPTQKRYIKVLDEKDRVLLRLPYNENLQERFHLLERNGTFYFLFRQGIRAMDLQGHNVSVALDKWAINMKIAPNGHLWVSTEDGLLEYDAGLKLLNSYFPQQDISDILFDNQGGMWVSSIEKGIYYCSNIYINYYNNIPGLSGNITTIRCFNNKLFIGTSSGNLYVKEKDSLRRIGLGNNAGFITDVIFYNNRYLIGTKRAILSLDEQLKLVDKGGDFNGINDRNNMLNAYAFDVMHDTLTFVTGSTIVRKYRSGPCEGVAGRILFKTRSLVHSGNEFYIGTSKGLFLLNKTVSIPPYLDVLRTKSIVRLRLDRKGNIWICTKGSGLYLLKPDHRLIRISTPTNVSLDLGMADDSTYLLSTNKGIFIARSAELGLKAPWRLLYGDEVYYTVLYDGELVMATNNQGLITMSCNALHRHNTIPLYLESFTVNNRKMSSSNIHLNYRQNDLYFNFDILKYDEDHLSFSYQLEGPDPDNGKVSGTLLHLNNLSPGYYRLYVYLTGPGNIRESTCFIPFYIEPAFWQVRFFIFEVIITGIALCILFTGFFYDRLKKRQLQKTMITRIIIEQRLTALKAQINPHFISNSLTGIQQLILENKIDKANQYIAKFSLLIRYILNYSDKPAALLSKEIEIIDLNIELEKLRFNNKFIFEKQVAPGLDVNGLYIPPLITQPLIENAIWHGLLPLKDHRTPTLVLKISIRDNKLVVSVIDNGVGRSKHAPGISNNRESRGIWLVQNRISSLNRLYPNAKSEFLFTDLYAPDGQPAGTQVDLVFPLIVLENLINDDKNEDPDY